MFNWLRFLFTGFGFILFAHAWHNRPGLETAASRSVKHDPDILTDSAVRVAKSARAVADKIRWEHESNACRMQDL